MLRKAPQPFGPVPVEKLREGFAAFMATFPVPAGARTAPSERLTGLSARPLNETKLPQIRTGGATFSVSQTTFADPEGDEFDLATRQPE